MKKTGGARHLLLVSNLIIISAILLGFIGMAYKVRSVIAENGIAARWGGDEFFGVLALAPQQAEELFATLMQRLNNEEKDSRYRVTISVGLAAVNSKLNVEQITKKADKALYCSKQNGRNQITHCENI